MPHSFFLSPLPRSYGVITAWFRNILAVGKQNYHLHSALAIVAYFCANYKFFDRRRGW